MNLHQLSVEEKANIELESHINNHAIHLGKTREEVLRDWTSDGRTQEQLYQDELNYIKRCQKLVEQLKNQGQQSTDQIISS